MKKIYLVRHAQSNSNVNVSLLQKTPNPNITLTVEEGEKQAKETGAYLSSLLTGEVVVWNSPYQRTRQTAQAIKQELKNVGKKFYAKENIYLSERQFGLIDHVANYRENYKDAINHYQLHSEHNSNFFARPPLGESPFDMAIRVDSFMKLYIENSKEDNHIIVSHGAALKGILMMCLGWTFEEYSQEVNFNNAGVRLITLEPDIGWEDKGYIYEPSYISS